MSRPVLNLEDAKIHMRPRDLARPSRAKPTGVVGRAGRPKFPDWLPEACRPLWNDIVKQLRRRRTCTPGDGPAIALYCRTHLQWQSACDDVEKRGIIVEETRRAPGGDPYTVTVVNPCVKIAADLLSELKESLHAMGLTGLSRAKVSEVKPKDRHADEVPGTVAFSLKHGPGDATASPEIPTMDDISEIEEKPDDAIPATESN